MKKLVLIPIAMTFLATACQDKSAQNPLLADFDTPFGVPPFDRIKTEHYMPAFEQAIAEARTENEAIAASTEAPTFANTIEALDRGGKRLGAIGAVFFNLNECETNDRMQEIAIEVSPKLTELHNDMLLDPKLFERVKAVYDSRSTLDLTGEQQMLLEKTYKSFSRNGAALSEEDKAKYRGITTELAATTLKFGQHVLGATNAFILHVVDSADLAGLPANAVEAAAEEAKAREKEGWVFTLQAPSMTPFLQYGENRTLREQLWRAYNARCLSGEFDNRDNIVRIVNLRLALANLLGYPSYADYVLEERMAGSSKAVNDFLNNLLEKSIGAARRDYGQINAYAKELGFVGEVMPWDFGYYQTRYKDARYNLNDEMTRPYFQLEKAEAAVFMLADKLYGITFTENKSLPVFHPDVKTFEVHDKDNGLLAILYVDYFPRAGKRGGAWMTSYREQYRTADGADVRPVVSLTCNFTKPTASTPSLLTYNEVETLLHEFGHCLHGIFAKEAYESLSGTNVDHDFVELPSQIMENWLPEKEFLDLWAAHYQTGEKMPQELIDKITGAQKFLGGYLNSGQLRYGMGDMAWHSITAPLTGNDVAAFERDATNRAQVLPYIDGTAMSPGFTHIFSGGYAAGYYSYKWAEVLDADAYSLFKEKGIFSAEVAQSFRDNILSKGGSEPPMELYVRFRGHEPSVDPLLERAGLK
ncbi:MAG: M3 family metallopeptidase [Rikenellaceae bacterium]|jgi:peptidyl-dipeptidase Dcp|nr:M3 family metallopeptidase [Rikenellaceae bacterium]